MSKRRFSLISENEVAPTNWDLCLICQANSREKLICSAKRNQKDKYTGYRSLENDLETFQKNNVLDVSICRLKENDQTILKTFIDRTAKYHKTCRNKYDQHHLES